MDLSGFSMPDRLRSLQEQLDLMWKKCTPMSLCLQQQQEQMRRIMQPMTQLLQPHRDALAEVLANSKKVMAPLSDSLRNLQAALRPLQLQLLELQRTPLPSFDLFKFDLEILPNPLPDFEDEEDDDRPGQYL